MWIARLPPMASDSFDTWLVAGAAGSATGVGSGYVGLLAPGAACPVARSAAVAAPSRWALEPARRPAPREVAMLRVGRTGG